MNSLVLGRPAQKGVDGPPSLAAAVVQIEVGAVEGQPQVVALGSVVEDPLGEGSDDSQAVVATGNDMVCFDLVLPRRHRVSASIDVLAELAAEIARENARPHVALALSLLATALGGYFEVLPGLRES